jgi:hypothetical protein
MSPDHDAKSPRQDVRIGERLVGDSTVLRHAEIGNNHNGYVDTPRRSGQPSRWQPECDAVTSRSAR